MEKIAAILFRASVFLLITLCAGVADTVVPIATVPSSTASPQEASRDAESDVRIQRIENGLLPAATIKGQAVQTMNLAERMEHYNVPGVSIAFFADGKISWTRSYGLADVATGRRVTSQTLFQSASISKPAAALGVLRLVQEGKLSLDEDVNLKLRSWKIPENEFTKEQKVTLRRILSHSAGMNIQRFPGYAAGEPLPTVVQILNGEKPANTVPIRVEHCAGHDLAIFRWWLCGYAVVACGYYRETSATALGRTRATSDRNDAQYL